jgi:feruloyl esterase
LALRNRSAIGVACLLLFVLTSCEQDVDLQVQCLAMSSAHFPGTTIGGTAVVTDREDLPGFCRVQGTIDPNIGFEARFPLAGWNGKYYQSGCGGYCGTVMPDKPGFSNTINEALRRGYAAITTDNGHEGGMGEASWAKGNPEAVAVYAHRGVLLTHGAGTAMTRAFYDAEPKREYFSGCSNGGRMAAMTAQRYPTLFDGILGGGGVLNLSYSGGVYGSWVVHSNSDEDGERILTHRNFAAKLPALERAVIEQCDASDGQTDGVISLPRRCDVDVAALPHCDEGSTNQCFTNIEKAVLEKWYQGPKNSAGEQLFPGMPAGSERFWAVWFLDTDARIGGGNQLGGRYAKYLGFEGGTPDDYTALDFDFDTDPQRLTTNGKLLDALDPDLSEFRDSGGKYLMWHGWADPLVLPDQSRDYYESVAAHMGGIDSIKSFYRLFMIPGQGHCWEMPSNYPEIFDPITTLDTWVETGEPPEKIHARARNPKSAVITDAVLCPHPATAVNLARGDSIEDVQCAKE